MNKQCLYYDMLRMRRVEERIAQAYPKQQMRCPTHLSIGQEYASACITQLKQPEDQAVSTHRPHAHYLAMGGDLTAMIKELYGQPDGCSSGRGGSMHLLDEDVGFMGSTAIVGNSIPLGVGLAWAKKITRTTGIVYVFIGDAAVEEGVFYESVNFALIHALPVLFVCENNGYSVYADMTPRQPKHRTIYGLAQGLGLSARQCDGYDLSDCYHQLRWSIQDVRSGQGPGFIEIQTYRFLEHCGVNEDDHLGYRNVQEITRHKNTDPLAQLKHKIEDNQYVVNCEEVIEHEIDQVFLTVSQNTADTSPITSRHTWATPEIHPTPTIPIVPTAPTVGVPFDNLTYAQAINQALIQAMTQDPNIICYGLGINDPKRIFGTTQDLLERFSANRVFDMPTAENAMLGIGIGAALNQLKPVMVHQRFDFFLLAMDQLVNNAAKWFFTFGRPVPLCIRLIVGRGWGQGPTHSQMLGSWLAHIPGLKVVMPSTAYDAKGLMLSAMDDPNPVIVIEHRWCHSLTSLVPQTPYRIPIGEAKLLQTGIDLTLVSASYYSIECLKAVDTLCTTHDIQVELIDLRSIAPIDYDMIFASVCKTGRLMVLDPGWGPMGIGNEIISQVVQAGLWLKAPPRCISLPHHPSPTAYEQSKDYYPDTLTIAQHILDLLEDDQPLDQTDFQKEYPADVPNLAFNGPF